MIPWEREERLCPETILAMWLHRQHSVKPHPLPSLFLLSFPFLVAVMEDPLQLIYRIEAEVAERHSKLPHADSQKSLYQEWLFFSSASSAGSPS